MILARTELAAIDALRASGEEPERILEFIDSIVTKGIDTGRFDMCHVEIRKPRSDSQRRCSVPTGIPPSRAR